jgi:hypothetical protein
MRYARLYAGADGVSRFEDATLELEPDGASEAPELVSPDLPVAQLRFLQLPPGWYQEQRPARSRRYLLVLAGVVDIEAGDGQVRRLGPGGVVLVEDTTGAGHRARVIGAGPATIAVAELPRDVL